MKWVIVAFVFFALFIGTLTTICIRQDISLVSPNYYQDELKHQVKMNQQQNMATLKMQPQINLRNEDLSIAFSSFKELEKGEMRLVRPSNAQLDQTFELTNQTEQHFKLAKWESGLYRVTVQWTMQGKEFYYEKLMVL